MGELYLFYDFCKWFIRNDVDVDYFVVVLFFWRCRIFYLLVLEWFSLFVLIRVKVFRNIKIINCIIYVYRSFESICLFFEEVIFRNIWVFEYFKMRF